jgi:hypothetical protein
MTKQPKRPRDANQLAKLIVDIATGKAQDTPDSAESPMAFIVALVEAEETKTIPAKRGPYKKCVA